MSKVVFAAIKGICDLENARWQVGDQDSYESTARMAVAASGRDDIVLIGRQDRNDGVALVFVANASGKLRAVSQWHVKLARFFMAALEQAPSDAALRPFIENFPAQVAFVARQLVSLRCGADRAVGDRALHDAVNEVNAELGLLGVPCGDWTFVPMMSAYHSKP